MSSEEFEEGLVIREEISDLSIALDDCVMTAIALKAKYKNNPNVIAEIKRVFLESTQEAGFLGE